ncbi:hypothetical protein BST98_18610 [Photobacterium damselae]|nr:hypothetical protein BST98_18610 [Photobacterium damselae]
MWILGKNDHLNPLLLLVKRFALHLQQLVLLVALQHFVEMTDHTMYQIRLQQAWNHYHNQS